MRNRSTKGINTKKITSFLALLSFTAYMPVSCLPAFADISATALPDLNKAVNGDVTTAGNRMDVSVIGGTGTVGQFDWNTFNVGKDAQVNWVFNANSQTALNRVLASGGMSYIYGKLTESSGNGCPSCVNTSKVILINPSGILFGNGSSVNLNSFTASTYDVKGVKNLQDLSEDQLKAYAGTGGKTGTLFDIAGYNKTVSFVANDNLVDGNGYITADSTGTRLASIVADGSTINANKSLAMVGNKIDIANSKLTTTYTSTPNASNGKQTRSNIKLVTGDGVNFYYTSAGNINNSVSVAKAEKKSGKQYGIDIKNSELKSGNILAYNGVEQNGSINIDKSTLRAKKLLGTAYTASNGAKYTAEQTGTDGNLDILSAGKVAISNSDVQTINDEKDGVKISTGIGYGNMTISGANEVEIKNTQLRTGDSKLNTDSNNIQAGNITINSAKGNVNLIQDAPTDSPYYNNTGIAAAGDLAINAAGNVNVDKYNKIQAVGHGTAHNSTSNTARSIKVNGNNVNFNETLVNAKNLVVNATDKIDVTKTDVVADTTKLIGANTTIDNSLLQYKDLAFYNSDKKNNVTIKNNTTFNDKDSDTLTISTNGNLTLDNATLQKAKYGSSTASNQKAVALESTAGNINVKNSNVTTTAGALTANAKAGAITVDNSTLYATKGNVELTAKNNVKSNASTIWAKDGDMKLTSTAGKVVALDSNIAAEGGNTTVSQALDMNIDADFLNSTIGSTNKLTLTSDGNITGGKLSAGTGYINDYKDLVSLNNDDLNIHFIFAGANVDAGKDVKISDLASANKVDFVAGNNIDLASKGDMTLTDVSTKAGNNTMIAAAAKLATDDLEILGGKKTTLSGKTVTTKGDSAIKTNGNKLAVNAEGAVDIAVTGVNNTNNGLEINADVNTSKGSAPLAGKTVKVNAKDGTLAISKIKADTLDIIADNILAAKTTISADKDNVSGLVENGVDMDSKGYIEVKTDGGFNLDATTDYNNGNKDIYTGGNYGTTVNENTVAKGDAYSKVTDTDVTKETVSNSEKIGSTTVKGEETGRVETGRTPVGEPTVETTVTENVVQNGEEGYVTTTTTTQEYEVTADATYKTTTTDTYKDTETTTTTTKTTTTTYQDYETTKDTRDTQHIATLNEKEQNGFVLVYGKNSQDKTTETKVVDTKVDTKVDTNTVVVNAAREEISYGSVTEQIKYNDKVTTTDSVFCAYEEDLSPDLGGDDVASWVRIPRHSEGISNVAPVQNDLADTTSTVVAAAARLQIEDDEEEILE